MYIIIYNYTSKRYSVGARLPDRTRYWFGKDAPDSLYVLLCRPLTDTSADQLEPTSSYSLELK